MTEKLILESDYQNKPIPISARIHKIIREYNAPINKDDLSYGLLKESVIEDCLDLDREWFYQKPNDFYYKESLKNENYYTLCCYWSPKEFKEAYVLGLITIYIGEEKKAMKYYSKGEF